MEVSNRCLLVFQALSLWLVICLAPRQSVFATAFQTTYKGFTIEKYTKLGMNSSPYDKNDVRPISQEDGVKKKKRKLAIATLASFFVNQSYISPAIATPVVTTPEETIIHEDVVTLDTTVSPTHKFKLGSKFSIAMAGTSAIIVGGAVLKRGEGANGGKVLDENRKEEFESIIGLKTPNNNKVEKNEEMTPQRKLKVSLDQKEEGDQDPEDEDEDEEKLKADAELQDKEAIENVLEQKKIEENRAKVKAAAVSKTIAEATRRAKEVAKNNADKVRTPVEKKEERREMLEIKSIEVEKKISEPEKKTEVEDRKGETNVGDLENGEESTEKPLLVNSEDVTATDIKIKVTPEGNGAEENTEVKDKMTEAVARVELENGTNGDSSTAATKGVKDTAKIKVASEGSSRTIASEDLGERAFNILLDLGMVERSRDPDDSNYDHSDDNEYV